MTRGAGETVQARKLLERGLGLLRTHPAFREGAAG